jgi:hypothetical protein
MGQRLPHQGRQLVREMDGEEAAHVVRLAARGIAAGELRRLLAAEPHRLVDQRRDLVGTERARGDAIALVAVLRGEAFGAVESLLHR